MQPEIVLNCRTESFPPAGHYSHTATAGGFVFVSGQLPVTITGEKNLTRHLKSKLD